MKFNATVAGVGMTCFVKYPDKGLKELGTEAVRAAVADALQDAPLPITSQAGLERRGFAGAQTANLRLSPDPCPI